MIVKYVSPNFELFLANLALKFQKSANMKMFSSQNLSCGPKQLTILR
jgi:hypothetical protein